MSVPAARSAEHWTYLFRRTWRGTFVTMILTPVLYLTAMGIGLGSYVGGGRASASLDGIDYLAFLAPGLLAANAMQVVAAEATWPVLGAIKWDGTYLAMLATPLRVADIFLGHLGWVLARITAASVVFLVIAAAFGTVRSPEATAALPAAVLVGLAFAAPVMAFSATRDNDAGFNVLFRLGIMPLFLFSGTFFPIDQLPLAIRWLAWVTPLWHGVSLCRALFLGAAHPWPALGHLAYLVALSVLGIVLALVAYRRRLRR